MAVTKCYDTSGQTYCPPKSSISVGSLFSTQTRDCLKVIRHAMSHELYPLVDVQMFLGRLFLAVKCNSQTKHSNFYKPSYPTGCSSYAPVSFFLHFMRECVWYCRFYPLVVGKCKKQSRYRP
jgi:hypothetical protein